MNSILLHFFVHEIITLGRENLSNLISNSLNISKIETSKYISGTNKINENCEIDKKKKE